MTDPLIAIQREWNAHVFHYYDPEGHGIEIWEKENGGEVSLYG